MRKKKITLFAVAVVLLSVFDISPLISVGQTFEVDFSRDQVTDLFETSNKKLPEAIDGQLLLPSQIATKEIPIDSGKKYKLEINARVDSDFVIEENDRALIQVLKAHQYRLTSTYRFTFQDAEGKSVKFHGSRTGFFLSKMLQPYTFVFTAPKDATTLKVHFQTNKRKTYLAALKLKEELDEKSINSNPDFRYGELNYSGWQPAREGRLYTKPDGKTVLHVGYNGASPYFPLSPGKKYRVTAVGKGGRMTLHYVNKEGKNLLSRAFGTVTMKGMEKEIEPPAGTVAARVTMLGSLVLEEFKVVEVE